MFYNPGNKIKILALISFIVDSLAAFIGGIVLFCEDAVLAGLGTIVGGIAAAYVIALLLYGFGELIEKACQIEENTGTSATIAPDSGIAPTKNYFTAQPKAVVAANRTSNANQWKCACGRIHQHYESSCVCGKTKMEMRSKSASDSQSQSES